AAALRVGLTLRHLLPVEVRHLLEEVHVVQQQRTIRPDGQRVAVARRGPSGASRGSLLATSSDCHQLSFVPHPLSCKYCPPTLRRRPRPRSHAEPTVKGRDKLAGRHARLRAGTPKRATPRDAGGGAHGGTGGRRGRLGTCGGSYMGFTQWALASTRPPHLKAMVVALATSVRSYS